MQPSSFTKDSPGDLVDIAGGLVAFVPKALPESLNLPTSVVAGLAGVERTIGRLVGAATAPAAAVNPLLVTAPLRRREAISSSRIEGTYTTPEQLALIELDDSLDDPEATSPAEAREVENYVTALDWGFERLGELPICKRLILELHGRLMSGVRGDEARPGEFRDVQNFIGASGALERARFVPPPVPAMHRCLDDLEAYVHSEAAHANIPTLVRVALVHYQFEAIHPFRDGNGRVGRLLIPLMLAEEDGSLAGLLYLSPWLEGRRGDYMDLLLGISQKGEFLPWIEFFLEAVEGSAKEGLDRITALLALREGYRQRVRGERASAQLLEVVDGLFQTPSLNVARVERVAGVSTPTASAYIKKLAVLGIIEEVTGRQRNRRFVARELLRVAHEAPSAGSG